MIAYVTLGSNNLDRSVAFYDAVLAELGAKRIAEMDRMKMYGTEAGGPMLGVCRPYNGKPAEPGNGTMVAVTAGSREQVDKLHAKALSLGAADEGAPGERMPGFYAAYFRDLDGNKFCVCVMG